MQCRKHRDVRRLLLRLPWQPSAQLRACPVFSPAQLRSLGRAELGLRCREIDTRAVSGEEQMDPTCIGKTGSLYLDHALRPETTTTGGPHQEAILRRPQLAYTCWVLGFHPTESRQRRSFRPDGTGAGAIDQSLSSSSPISARRRLPLRVDIYSF